MRRIALSLSLVLFVSFEATVRADDESMVEVAPAVEVATDTLLFNGVRPRIIIQDEEEERLSVTVVENDVVKTDRVVIDTVEVDAAKVAGVADVSEIITEVLATPTHHQAGLIKANAAGLQQIQLKCFCLTPDNRIVAGCAGDGGELRVFDEAGEYVESWSTPFEPEAIYVRADGAIFVAGAGQLARLSSRGEVELQQDAPHSAAMGQNLDAIREEVITQNKRQGEMFVEQAGQYDAMIAKADEQIQSVQEQLSKLKDETSEEDRTDASKTNDLYARAEKARLEQRLAMQEQMKKQYEEVKKQWDEMAEQNKPKELTDEEIEKLVEQSLAYKKQASSISATDEYVFLATRSAVGYGFEVWKMDAGFANGEKIISGLSGCCGQMDVKANANGLYVAENSKHRVCRYDLDGKLISTWGHGARKGLEGFGSCCNPMNVAFGPEGVVYTAEDNTGRVKRYSPEGELLGLVGSAELVPGCKNVSIAVNGDGSRVYMLDITRGHIVRMEPYKPGEAPAPKVDESAGGVANPGGAVAQGLLEALGF